MLIEVFNHKTGEHLYSEESHTDIDIVFGSKAHIDVKCDDLTIDLYLEGNVERVVLMKDRARVFVSKIKSGMVKK